MLLVHSANFLFYVVLLFTHNLSSRNFTHNVPSRNYSLETNSSLESERGEQINVAVSAVLCSRGNATDFNTRTQVKLLLHTGNVEPNDNSECKRNPDTVSPSLLEKESIWCCISFWTIISATMIDRCYLRHTTSLYI